MGNICFQIDLGDIIGLAILAVIICVFTKVIKEDVLSYIALKYSKDIRQLEGALNRLVFYAESFKKQTKKRKAADWQPFFFLSLFMLHDMI